MNISDLVIDKEFKAILPAPQKQERFDLEKAIVDKGGFTDPIFAWRDNGKAIIADGMTRFSIWEKHKDRLAPPRVEVLDLPDRDAVILWMLRRQLGRRNLNGNAARMLRGRMYKAIKADAKKNLKQGGKATETAKTSKTPMFSPKGQNVPSGDEQSHKAAKEVAKETGVNEKTVRRDAEFVDAIDAIAKVNDKAAKDIADGAIKLPAKDVLAIAKLDAKDVGKALSLIRRGQDWKQAKPKEEKKPGKPIFDDRIVQKAIDELVKLFDKRVDAIGEPEDAAKKKEWSKLHADCIDAMGTVLAAWKRWQKATV